MLRFSIWQPKSDFGRNGVKYHKQTAAELKNLKKKILSYILEMAQPISFYKCKFRVENLIYTEILTSTQFEELRVHGMESSVVRTLDRNNFSSAVVGSFKYKVETLSVVPENIQREVTNQAEAMEMEVKYFFI